jgi:hypothetical protein
MTPGELLDMAVCEVLANQPAAVRVFLNGGMSCRVARSLLSKR